MKNAKKLLGMVLTLSLVLTLLCGVPAAAEEKDERLLANGSAELLDETGRPVGITGGTLIQEGAKDGQNMMQVAAGETMHMQLALAETAKIAKIRGSIKPKDFTADSSVTVSIKADSIDGTELTSKTFTAKPEGSETDSYLYVENDVWEYIRFSAVSIKAALVVSVSVTGTGSVYVDGVTIEKDNNILVNPEFNLEESGTWKIQNWDEAAIDYDITDTTNAAGLIHTDKDCPDGENYVVIDQGRAASSMITFTPNATVLVTPGERYIFSFWYKSELSGRAKLEALSANATAAANIYEKKNIYGDNSTAATNAAQVQNYMMADLKSTGGEWKQLAFTMTIPQEVKEVRAKFYAHKSPTTGEFDFTVCMPSLEKLEESKIGYYKPASSLVSAYEWYCYPFVTLLGEPVEDLEGYTDTLNAVYVTNDAPEVISDSSMILAAYRTDTEGKKQLMSVTFGDKAVRPAQPPQKTGVGQLQLKATDSAEATLLYGVAYPTVSVSATGFADADEIRAFAWDDISGLKPAGAYAVLTK